MSHKVLDGELLYEDGIKKDRLLLEEGQRSERLTIIERFNGSWCDLKEQPVTESVQKLGEAQGSGALLVLEGRFQMADTKNANNRIYPNSIWERVLTPGSSALKRVSGGEMLGELDHPNDGQTRLARVACMVSEVRRNSNDSKEILGKIVVFNTTEGKKVKAIIDGGGRIGVSSRGQGSVVRTEGVDVVQEDFELETWDIVHNPSTPGAFPEVVQESSTRIESVGMSSLQDYKQRLARLQERKLSELPQEALEVILDEAKDIKAGMLQTKWSSDDSVHASGLIAEAAIFASDLGKVVEGKDKKVSKKKTPAVVDKEDDETTDAEGAGECSERLSRLSSEQEVFEALCDNCVLTNSMEMSEAVRTARMFLRETFEIEGPLRQYETSAVSKFVQEAPRRENNISEACIKATITFPSDADLSESTSLLESLDKDLTQTGEILTLSLDTPALKSKVVESLKGTGAIIEWDERDLIYADCAARFENLMSNQIKRTTVAESVAETVKAGSSELSLKHTAAKQVMGVLTNRVRVAEARANDRGSKLEAAYSLIEALVEEFGVENLRGVVAGIAATHPKLDTLGEKLSEASGLKDAVIITKRAILEETTPLTMVRETAPSAHEALQLSETRRLEATQKLAESTAPTKERGDSTLAESTRKVAALMPSSRST